MNTDSLLIWHKFNAYNFIESTHQYFYYNAPVKYSVTQFIAKFYKAFDSEGISKKYAEKHNIPQEEVLADWKKKGDMASCAGTIIHSWLENAKRGKTFDIDYSQAEKLGIKEEVESRVKILLPQAKMFHEDTLNKLFPIQLEYTVGIEDYIAGNIDMLCWNKKVQEFQIWDYKNLKHLDLNGNIFTKKCFYPFEAYKDTNYIHYCIQLNMYKCIIQRVLNVPIGKCYLVKFDYINPDSSFEIHPCIDLQNECNKALDLLLSNQL